MENGVKILIERIKTNPEEFGETGDRWSSVVGKFRQFMSAEDRVALDEALRPVLMEKFNKEVLNTLIRTEQEQEQSELVFGAGNGESTITYKTKGRLITS
jgi:hypothetical protein